jgi:hypothetical protein
VVGEPEADRPLARFRWYGNAAVSDPSHEFERSEVLDCCDSDERLLITPGERVLERFDTCDLIDWSSPHYTFAPDDCRCECPG